MTQYLIYFSVFVLAVLLTSLVGNQLASGAARTSAVNRRMQVLEWASDGYAGLVDIRRERGLGSDGKLGSAFRSLGQLYLQSGVVMGWRRLILYAAAGGIVAGLAASYFTRIELIGVGAGIAAFVFGPYMYLNYRRNKRITAFQRQLADAIDIITRSLYAGHPLTTSLGLVASEMPDPMGSEFGMLNDELTYGTPMDVALTNLMERVPVEDLAMFSMTIVIQRQTGGNLAEILESLSAVIRERYILKQRIKSLTAEGRFSAIFMTLFPLFMYLIINILSPGYFDSLWESGYGATMFTVSTIVVLIGNYIMRRMINFKV